MRRYLVTMLQIVVLGTILTVKADVDVSVNFSFGELNDYGEWVHVGGYGKVWRPYADPDWRPFMYGHWEYTNDGWMWDSDEPFGWIVCHYGNWYYDDDYGWVWVPGYDWSPARVDWYVTDNEIAWMPLFPPPLPGHVRAHHRPYWMFCPTSAFASVEVRNHVVVRAVPQAGATVVVHRGPPRVEVVRRLSRAPLVAVAPRRVVVRSNERTFVRVESERPARERVVVPVGPRYRRGVTVRSAESPHQSSTVTVTHEADAPVIQHVEPQPRRTTVEVHSSGSEPMRRARVEGEGHGGNDDEQHGQTKVKVKVKKRD